MTTRYHRAHDANERLHSALCIRNAADQARRHQQLKTLAPRQRAGVESKAFQQTSEASEQANLHDLQRAVRCQLRNDTRLARRQFKEAVSRRRYQHLHDGVDDRAYSRTHAHQTNVTPNVRDMRVQETPLIKLRQTNRRLHAGDQCTRTRASRAHPRLGCAKRRRRRDKVHDQMQIERLQHEALWSHEVYETHVGAYDREQQLRMRHRCEHLSDHGARRRRQACAVDRVDEERRVVIHAS
jgi:hypothetical protein